MKINKHFAQYQHQAKGLAVFLFANCLKRPWKAFSAMDTLVPNPRLALSYNSGTSKQKAAIGISKCGCVFLNLGTPVAVVLSGNQKESTM